jgi:hypothetical protein
LVAPDSEAGSATALAPGRGLPLDEIRTLADGTLGVIRVGPELEAAAEKLAGSDDPAGHHTAQLIAWLLSVVRFRNAVGRKCSSC